MSPPPLRLFEFYKKLSGLRHIWRFQRFPIMWKESVAEHSYYVAVLVDLFAEQLRSLGHTIEPRVTLYALWHDAAEAITGDTPHDIKRRLGEAFEALETEAEETLTKMSGTYEGFPSPAPGSIEATLVKLADWVELLLYTATERQGGNYTIEIAERRIWKLLDEPVRDRMKHFGAEDWYRDLLIKLWEETGGPGGGVPFVQEPL